MEQNKQPEQSERFSHIVRIASTDLDGNKKIIDALRKIKGVGFSFANAVCEAARIDKNKKAGYLNTEDVKQIDKTIRSAQDGIPLWMLNRRRDRETGENKHLIGADLTFATENDIRSMMQIRSYRGIRHAAGAPVRGQRTRSNFRKNKGKVTGVIKKRIAAAAGTSQKEEKKK